MNWRLWLIGRVLLAATCSLFLLPPIPQSQIYHGFADQRALLGLPHCLDVSSNVPFLIFGVWGIFFVLPGGAE